MIDRIEMLQGDRMTLHLANGEQITTTINEYFDVGEEGDNTVYSTTDSFYATQWQYATTVAKPVRIYDMYGHLINIHYSQELHVDSRDNGVFLRSDTNEEVKIFDESGLGHRLNSLKETVSAMDDKDPIKALVKKELIKIMEDCGLTCRDTRE